MTSRQLRDWSMATEKDHSIETMSVGIWLAVSGNIIHVSDRDTKTPGHGFLVHLFPAYDDGGGCPASLSYRSNTQAITHDDQRKMEQTTLPGKSWNASYLASP